MGPIAAIVYKIKSLFQKSAIEAADILTEGVIDIFAAAKSALEEANELYEQASLELTEEIADLQDAVLAAIEERSSVTAAVGANRRRADKLSEFLG